MNDAFGQPQTVVVLGGTSEIGAAIVRRLARRAETVVLAGRDEPAMKGIGQELESIGVARVPTVSLEAADPATVAQVVKACFSEAGGPVDLIVLAVGWLGDQARDEQSAEGTTAMLTVNTTWPAAALAACAARMQEQGYGRIVVLSSVAAVRVRRANYVYGAAKAGLDAYAIGLSEAVRGSGVKVHVVRPGFVRTKMTAGMSPAPFSTTAEAVAEAVAKGLEADRTVIWAPPMLQWVFSLLRQLPQALWRRLPG